MWGSQLSEFEYDSWDSNVGRKLKRYTGQGLKLIWCALVFLKYPKILGIHFLCFPFSQISAGYGLSSFRTIYLLFLGNTRESVLTKTQLQPDISKNLVFPQKVHQKQITSNVFIWWKLTIRGRGTADYENPAIVGGFYLAGLSSSLNLCSGSAIVSSHQIWILESWKTARTRIAAIRSQPGP